MKHHMSKSPRKLLHLGAVAFAGGALAVAFSSSPAWSAVTAPNLASAAAASVVAATTVTNTGATTLSGNLDLYPGTSVTGFPPGIVGGTQNVGGPVGGPANTASNDVIAAYLQAMAAPATATMNTDLGGQSLTAGVYAASSGLALTGTVTLVGDASSVFIFQSVSTLIVAPASHVVLSGGVQACNVFWQVGSSATLGTTASFVGNILALTSISMATGASLQGRALVRNGGVTLDGNVISSPTCNAVPPTTTTSTTFDHHVDHRVDHHVDHHADVAEHHHDGSSAHLGAGYRWWTAGPGLFGLTLDVGRIHGDAAGRRSRDLRRHPSGHGSSLVGLTDGHAK